MAVFWCETFKDMNIHPEIYKIMRLWCLRGHIQRILFCTTVSSGWCGHWTFWDFLLTTWVPLYFSVRLISVPAWTWDTKECLPFRYSHNLFVSWCLGKVASRALSTTQAWLQVLISHGSFYLHSPGRVKKVLVDFIGKEIEAYRIYFLPQLLGASHKADM